MPNLDWEDEDVPDGIDPKTAPVMITRRPVSAPRGWMISGAALAAWLLVVMLWAVWQWI